MKLSFRVRSPYYAAIVKGEKTVEVRVANAYWRARATGVESAFMFGREATAVFVCGRAVHRRKIVRVKVYGSAREALGREPSEQGKNDLGDGPVIGFHLGEVVEVRT